MKKKILIGMVSALLAVGMALPAGASEPENETEKSMTVGYQEPSTYILNIPSSVTLSETETVSRVIALSDVNVSTTEKVQIKVKEGISGGKVTLTDLADSTNTHSSTVSLSEGGTGISDHAVVAEFTDSTTALAGGGALYFSALGDIPAGEYQGTITFEASIVTR